MTIADLVDRNLKLPTLGAANIPPLPVAWARPRNPRIEQEGRFRKGPEVAKRVGQRRSDDAEKDADDGVARAGSRRSFFRSKNPQLLPGNQTLAVRFQHLDPRNLSGDALKRIAGGCGGNGGREGFDKGCERWRRPSRGDPELHDLTRQGCCASSELGIRLDHCAGACRRQRGTVLQTRQQPMKLSSSGSKHFLDQVLARCDGPVERTPVRCRTERYSAHELFVLRCHSGSPVMVASMVCSRAAFLSPVRVASISRRRRAKGAKAVFEPAAAAKAARSCRWRMIEGSSVADLRSRAAARQASALILSAAVSTGSTQSRLWISGSAFNRRPRSD